MIHVITKIKRPPRELDDDGMVVVSQEQCRNILEKSLQRIETEKKKTAQLRAGGSSVE